MYHFNCIIQEGVIPDDLRPELVSGLVRVTTSVLGGSPDDVDVEFTVMPHGYAFRGGEISTTSSVRGTIPPGCQQETRVQLMQQISDMWMGLTGCTVYELVVSARDRE